MSSLNTSLANLKLSSPLIMASGIMGLSASSLNRMANSGAAAVTAKSCSLKERKGHPCPSILPFEHGLLNAVGLSNPGAEEMAAELSELKKTSQTPVIASVFAGTVEEFPEVAHILAKAQPDMIEVNVSCPNVEDEFGRSFAADPDLTAKITRQVKKTVTDIPISIKISLQCPSIAEVAKACQKNGADAITAINSVGPGMLIDTNSHKPILANRVGGLSGPCILPLALRAVWEVYKAVSIPIIGTGGIETATDAIQMILAGATAAGIGTAVYTKGIDVFSTINRELHIYLKERNLASISQLRGAAHG